MFQYFINRHFAFASNSISKKILKTYIETIQFLVNIWLKKRQIIKIRIFLFYSEWLIERISAKIIIKSIHFRIKFRHSCKLRINTLDYFDYLIDCVKIYTLMFKYIFSWTEFGFPFNFPKMKIISNISWH